MTHPYAPIFPDARRRIQDYLRTHPYLTAKSAKVAPNMNGYNSTLFWVEVTEAPGSRINLKLDLRNFSFNVYAPTLEDTRDLAERALAAAVSMKGAYTDLVVTQSEVQVTPFDLTDQIDNRYRFVFDVTFYIRPL